MNFLQPYLHATKERSLNSSELSTNQEHDGCRTCRDRIVDVSTKLDNVTTKLDDFSAKMNDVSVKLERIIAWKHPNGDNVENTQ